MIQELDKEEAIVILYIQYFKILLSKRNILDLEKK